MTTLPERATATDTSPAVVLRHLSTGFWISQAIAVVANLGIADHLQHGAKSCAELAPAVGAHVGALYRLLRGIASVGIFAEDDQGRFALTAAVYPPADHRVAFSLLVCQAHLLPFYGRLGWLPFPGRLVVEQPGGSIVFTVNCPMVLPGLCPAPQEGVIDLRGLPW